MQTREGRRRPEWTCQTELEPLDRDRLRHRQKLLGPSRYKGLNGPVIKVWKVGLGSRFPSRWPSGEDSPVLALKSQGWTRPMTGYL